MESYLIAKLLKSFVFSAFCATFAFNMKKIIPILLCIFLVGCHENLKERAVREAQEFTRKNCPQRLEGGLQLDSMVFNVNDSTLHHYYTISGVADSAAVFVEHKKEIRTGLKESIHNNVQMRTFKEAGFYFGFTVCSKKHPGQVLYEERFSKKEY